MKMTAFVDLLHRDEYSLKHALGNSKQILPILKERQQTHYAIANYGEISNWVQQLFTCKDHGIVPVLGMETFVNNYRCRTDDNGKIIVKDLTNDTETPLLEMDGVSRDLTTIDYPLDLYARTVEGYYNIIKIHNDAQLHGVDKRPRTYDKYLETHGKGIVSVMYCPYSEVGSLVFNGMQKEAFEKLRYYRDIFDEVYLTVTMVEDEEYRGINEDVIRFCKRYGVPFIPVCNSHYIGRDDGEAWEVMRKLAFLRGGMMYEIDSTPHLHYRTREEVDELFHSIMESEVFTQSVYDEAMRTLDSLIQSFTLLDLDYSLKLPKFKDGDKLLREKAMAGFIAKGYDKKSEEYRKRLDYELDNIIGAGFADYFLILEELFSWHKRTLSDFTAFGRGSAAGSIVLNCIGCTNVDPVQSNLLFERFLDFSRFESILKSGGQVSGSDCPDVDSDFATDKRDLVKQHFADVYGAECTASIGTIGLMKSKSLLKDLARLYEVSPEEVNEVTSVEMKGFADSMEDEDGNPADVTIDRLKQMFPGLDRLLRKYPKMGEVFDKLYGSINTLGVHAGGVLITDFDLTEQLPMRVSKEGKLVTCWTEGLSSRELGMMGFIKFDMLAIDQLNIIDDTRRLIKENRGIDISPYEIPMGDYKALKQMENHDGLCIFQFDTKLAGEVADRMGGIKRFEDLAALSTLMRPAALSNKFDKLFGELRNAKGGVYMPECLKPYLADTFGLPIYQEHIMQSAMALAGFDKVTAYKFMKNVYKSKIKTQQDKDYWRKKFVHGSMKKVKHKAIEVEFEDGTTRVYEEWDEVDCTDGQKHTIREVIDKGLEIA